MYQDKYVDLLGHISQEELVELTRALVRFKSINPPGDELEVAKYAGDLLAREGLEVELLQHSESRGSLVAKLPGGSEPGLVFCGHLDVVPAEGPWQRDPYAAEVDQGKIWGRGTTDMKGGVAAMMAGALALARTGLPLRGPLYLSLTAGEESDNYGAAETVKHYQFDPVQAVFIAEPSHNEVYTAEKGAFWLEIVTHGRAAHISRMEEGRNALLMMLPILNGLQGLDIPFEPHPLLDDYRRSPNVILAGENTNTIPATCTLRVDQRTLPGQDHAEILAKIEAMVQDIARTSNIPDFSAEVKVLLDNPPLEVSYDHPALQKLLAISAEVNGSAQAGPMGVGYFTDAVKLVPVLDAPFAVCGPGNPRLNHQADEWVAIDKLMDSAKIYALAGAEYLL